MDNTKQRPRLHAPSSLSERMQILVLQLKKRYPDLQVIWTCEETPALYMHEGAIGVIEGENTIRAFTNLV